MVYYKRWKPLVQTAFQTMVFMLLLQLSLFYLHTSVTHDFTVYSQHLKVIVTFVFVCTSRAYKMIT